MALKKGKVITEANLELADMLSRAVGNIDKAMLAAKYYNKKLGANKVVDIDAFLTDLDFSPPLLLLSRFSTMCLHTLWASCQTKS